MFVDVEVTASVTYRGMVEVPDFGDNDDHLDAYMEKLLGNEKILDGLDKEEATIINTNYDVRA
jgi:hypothetical protein